MKSIFPSYMPNADLAGLLLICGILLFVASAGASRDLDKQSKHDYPGLWYGSIALFWAAVVCWIVMIGELMGL